MCLGIPAKIIKISGDIADVEIGGVTRKANIQLIESPQLGDYIILHAGFAIQKVDEQEAKETLRLLNKIYEIS